MSKKSDEYFKKNKPIFKYGIRKNDNIPISNIKEIAFIGTSNVGKSSLINSITNSKIAIVSKMPGRTRQLNFFQIGQKLTLVDMPGYGYAKAQKIEIENWKELIFQYLMNRKNLQRVFLLIDSRHSFKSDDEEIMKILDKCGISYQIILTKIDKKNSNEVNLKEFNNICKKHIPLLNDILYVSSEKKIGINQVREIIYDIIK